MRDLSNEHIRSELGRRLRRLRLDRNRTQAMIAANAGVDPKVLSRLERGNEISLDSFIAILRALDLLDRLDELVPDAIPSPIAELGASRRPRRQRARPVAAEQSQPWSWGDESPGEESPSEESPGDP